MPKKFKIPKEVDKVFKMIFPIMGFCLIIACAVLIIVQIKSSMPFN